MAKRCTECKHFKRPKGMHVPGDMICELTGMSLYAYHPYNLRKAEIPDWCPKNEKRN